MQQIGDVCEDVCCDDLRATGHIYGDIFASSKLRTSVLTSTVAILESALWYFSPLE